MAHLIPEKNNGSYYVDEEEDDGEPRPCWNVEACPPFAEARSAGCGRCSHQSWKKAAVWSYISEDKCRQYLMHHLKYAGAHRLDDDAVDELVQKVEVS